MTEMTANISHIETRSS